MDHKHEWCMFDKEKKLKKKPTHMLILNVFKTRNDSRNIMYLHGFFIIENL